MRTNWFDGQESNPRKTHSVVQGRYSLELDVKTVLICKDYAELNRKSLVPKTDQELLFVCLFCVNFVSVVTMFLQLGQKRSQESMKLWTQDQNRAFRQNTNSKCSPKGQKTCVDTCIVK